MNWLMHKVRQLGSNLRSSFWLVPSLIVAVSAVFAAVLIETDSMGSDRWLTQWPRLFGAGAQGARDMMSTIAGSMMTVVGVTFSMILVVLALASSQYTSRILRNFMRSSITQVVLGIFAGIFTYCLIVLRTIRGGEEGAFVPNLAVFFGFVMALGGVGALMFFIHHIASSIQASSIIASVAEETIATIDRLFPERQVEQEPDTDTHDHTLRALTARTWRGVPSTESGYIQNVNMAGLVRVAKDKQTIVRMEHTVGGFVVQHTTLLSLALEDEPDAETMTALQEAFNISRYRTVEQDVAFGIRQIVDVALKALSPGINDTTTAVMCVDYLSTILARLAPRHIPSPSYHTEKGELRVIARGASFENLLADSFDQIRSNANGDLAIMVQMLGALHTIAGLTVRPERRRALRDQVQWIADLAARTLESAHDRARIDTHVARVREALDTGRAVRPHMQSA